MRKILIAVLILGLVGIEGLMVKAATTDLDQLMTGQAKSLTSPGTTVSFAGANVSTTSAGPATGTITPVQLTNPKGDGTKSDTTMTVTRLATIGSVLTVAGSNDTVGTSGTYDGSYGDKPGSDLPLVRYDIIIVGAGDVGVATFDWSCVGDAGCGSGSAVTTAASVVLEKGISVTFTTASYAINDEWQFGVDAFGYTDLTVTPSSLTVVSGSADGMAIGSAEAMSGTAATSDSKTMFTTEYYRAMGDYQQDAALSWVLHKNSLEGTYTATATFTNI